MYIALAYTLIHHRSPCTLIDMCSACMCGFQLVCATRKTRDRLHHHHHTLTSAAGRIVLRVRAVSLSGGQLFAPFAAPRRRVLSRAWLSCYVYRWLNDPRTRARNRIACTSIRRFFVRLLRHRQPNGSDKCNVCALPPPLPAITVWTRAIM